MTQEEMSQPATKGDVIRIEEHVLDLAKTVGKLEGSKSGGDSMITWFISVGALLVALWKDKIGG